MKWSEDERKALRSAKRLRRNLRWGKSQLWICVLAACAVAYIGRRGDNKDTAGLLIAIGLYFIYRVLRVLMWRMQLKAKLDILGKAGLFTLRRSASASRT